MEDPLAIGGRGLQSGSIIPAKPRHYVSPPPQNAAAAAPQELKIPSSWSTCSSSSKVGETRPRSASTDLDCEAKPLYQTWGHHDFTTTLYLVPLSLRGDYRACIESKITNYENNYINDTTTIILSTLTSYHIILNCSMKYTSDSIPCVILKIYCKLFSIFYIICFQLKFSSRCIETSMNLWSNH